MTRRLCRALVLALVLAGIGIATAHLSDVVGTSPCAYLNPDTDPWLWWFWGCPKDAGGGGSGAS